MGSSGAPTPFLLCFAVCPKPTQSPVWGGDTHRWLIREQGVIWPQGEEQCWGDSTEPVKPHLQGEKELLGSLPHLSQQIFPALFAFFFIWKTKDTINS